MMIEVKGLCKSFGDLEVLKNLDLSIDKGQTLVIMGRSGCGKSVLLKHLIGITEPDSGDIRVQGTSIVGVSEKDCRETVKSMGMLFQGGALFDSMNIFENVSFFLREHGELGTGQHLNDSEMRDRVAEALSMVALEGVEKKMPSDLSGGMRKRAALARIIIYRPHILLYDEPTTGLDPVTAMQINELIMQIQEELKATSIVVTHDIQSALKIADSMAFHVEGRLKYVAKKDDFIHIDDPMIQDFFHNALSQKVD